MRISTLAGTYIFSNRSSPVSRSKNQLDFQSTMEDLINKASSSIYSNDIIYNQVYDYSKKDYSGANFFYNRY